MDKGIFGIVELSTLIVRTKWEGFGRGMVFWDDIFGWMRGKNGVISMGCF